MWHLYLARGKVFLHTFLASSVLLMFLLIGIPTNGTALAGSHQSYRGPVACPAVGDISSDSLLVVLLDRSGSLTAQPGATDPNGYATSVTKALADLWPGQMTVIPFTGDTTPLPVFGPYRLSDPAQRTTLKGQVEGYPIGGDTPLGPAMQQAQAQLKGAAPGSRVIVITDGNPTGQGDQDGPHQEKNIRQNLIPQFCSQGIPVSTLGLTIDLSNTDGQDANRLLADIANGTGATYKNVRSPEELADAVIRLYADWQHLYFTKEMGQGNNFPVAIDSFAQQASIVAFRSDGNYSITFNGPDKRPITQGVQISTDRHYEIVSLNVGGTIIAGTYIVNTSNDPNAQVYALVQSPLQVHINAPTSQTVAYIGQSVSIDAVFLQGNDLLTPEQGQAQMIAHVMLLVNGQQVGPTNDIVLTQQGVDFKGQTLAYSQVGQLVIVVDGNYQQVQRESSVTLQLRVPPPPPHISVSPTTLNQNTCSQQSNGSYTCKVTISETSSGTVNWTASGGNINPATGTLSPNQASQQVSISHVACQNTAFTFRGQGSNTVSVPWTCTPPPPPCTAGFLNCLWKQYSQQILFLGIPGLLLLILLVRLGRTPPYGVLEDKSKGRGKGDYVFLKRKRFSLRHLFSSAVIDSSQLAGRFDLKGGQFKLTFGGGAHIKAKSNTPPIKVVVGRTVQPVQRSKKSGTPLSNGADIHINNTYVATFWEKEPANQGNRK